MRKVLIDMDGVVLDLLGAIKTLLPDFKPENVETYGFGGDIGVKKHDVISLFHDINLFKNQKTYPRTEEALAELRKVAELYAYTLAPKDDEVTEYRNHQIEMLGINGRAYTHYEVGREKPVLDGYDALFEDCVENVVRWLPKTETRLYLIDRTYNRENPDVEGWDRVVRCSDFYDAVQRFVEEVST